MSNFYKKLSVNDGMYTRVIDNNSILEEKLSQIAHQMEKERLAKLRAEQGKSEDASEGEVVFREGILGSPQLEVDPEMELNYVEHAKEEADRIIARAAEEAGQILERAKQEAEALKERVFHDAENQGYAQGKQQAEEEADVLRQEIEGQRIAQEQQYEKRLSAMEQELMQVICTVFERVFQIELEDRQDVLLTLIQNAVQKIKDTKVFRIRVSETDLSFLQERKSMIQQKTGADLTIEILSDASYDPGQCTIDTESGIFDCSIDTELKELIKELRILSCMDGDETAQ